MKIKLSKYSISRFHQYKELKKLTLNGQILDLGGRKKEDYHSLIKGSHSFTAANLSRNRLQKDIELNVEEKFNLEAESFDHVLASNLLEHVYNFQNVIDESFRVLKPGGTITMTTPFMANIHRTPNDYLRYTDQAFEEMLKKAGFTVQYIKPLAYGPFRLMAAIFLPAIPTRPLKTLWKWKGELLDATLIKLSKSYKRKALHIPQAYIVHAQKPQT